MPTLAITETAVCRVWSDHSLIICETPLPYRIFLKFCFYFDLYVYVYASAHRGHNEDLDLQELGLLADGFWWLNPGPLEEQQSLSHQAILLALCIGVLMLSPVLHLWLQII